MTESEGAAIQLTNRDGDTITIEDIREAMDFMDDDDTPDGAYWAMVADVLGIEVHDVWDALASDPAPAAKGEG